MDLLKTPHQYLLEEAGAVVPHDTSLINSPKQLMMQDSQVPPHFQQGGQMTPQDMMAAMVAQGQTPQHFKEGGSALEKALKFGGKSLLGLGITATAADAAENAQQNNPGGLALNGLDLASFLSANPWLGALSGILSPSPLGKGTREEYEAENRPEGASILYGTTLPPQKQQTFNK